MAAGTFRRITDIAALPAGLRGCVVAVGNFDGVHRGHLSVLERALDRAQELSAPALVLTFEPHPRSFFRPSDPIFRLTPAPMRARLLELAGLDAVVELGFDEELATTTAEGFVAGVLDEGLGARHVITGFDFHFGKDRQGGPAFLMQAGERLGFGVTLVDAFRDEDTHIVSSSRIRDLLCEGDVAQAAGLLGYRYTVEAAIGGGARLGRTLGFPTANMKLPDDNGLRHGIYAVRLRRADGSLYDGVASFGRRPTVEDEGGALLETHVFDFNEDLYGETCAVSFFGYLRPELKFDGLDPLVAQMRRDGAEARALLSGVKPLGGMDAAVAF